MAFGAHTNFYYFYGVRKVQKRIFRTRIFSLTLLWTQDPETREDSFRLLQSKFMRISARVQGYTT